MAGIEPEVTEKPNPVKPGDRWITIENGRMVERTRNAAGDGWDEVPLDDDMPMSLARAHELLIELYTENRSLRSRVSPEAPVPAPRTITERAATTPTRVAPKPCGGCGKKAAP